MDDIAINRCPECGFEEIDMSDLGFTMCQRCKFCAHPVATTTDRGAFRCMICGRVFHCETGRQLVGVAT